MEIEKETQKFLDTVNNFSALQNLDVDELRVAIKTNIESLIDSVRKECEEEHKKKMLIQLEKEAREFIPLYNNDGTGKHSEGTDEDYLGFIANLILRLELKYGKNDKTEEIFNAREAYTTELEERIDSLEDQLRNLEE